jgi:streptogramin lyase
MVFDAKGNLYTVSGGVSHSLNILSNSDKWSKHIYDHFSGVSPNQIIIAKDGKKWVNFFRRGSASTIGIFVLDDTDNDKKDKVYFAAAFVDQQPEPKNVGATTYSCIVEDKLGTIWVGTDNGPITFSSAEQLGRGQCNRPIGVDLYGEAHYLLEGQRVTSIAVDGGNRKWIGTSGGGVFLVELSGDDFSVTNFNTFNSQILSDNINSIAINGKTGEVFIGTNRGICSYMGDAIDGKSGYSEVYAYPNPVFPNRYNQVVVTGLMQNSRIKITDLAGNLMREAVSNGGQYTWNCTNSRGEIVSAGIYLVFATLPDGARGVVTKIMVIK